MHPRCAALAKNPIPTRQPAEPRPGRCLLPTRLVRMARPNPTDGGLKISDFRFQIFEIGLRPPFNLQSAICNHSTVSRESRPRRGRDALGTAGKIPALLEPDLAPGYSPFTLEE